jgi:glycosyltransferase involved in cell wall biosynthesis
MIPKIIHYCWVNSDKQKPLPQVVLDSIASWKKYLPDYQFKLWNEDTFDVNSTPFTKETCQTRKFSFLSDYIRVYALYHEGGIYLDCDVEILKNIDKLLDNKAFTAVENPYILGSAIIGSEKGGAWIKSILDYYEGRHFILPDASLDVIQNNYIHTRITEYAGMKLDNTLQKFEQLTVYPKKVFYPGYTKNDATENSLFVHHCMASWVIPISIVMPAYNAEKHIKESIESVLNQTFGRFELIIVDDGSTDDTLSIIKSYTDSRIAVVENKHDFTGSLNLGIKRTTGSYIARMDADDVMRPNRLQVQYEFMERHPEVDVCGSWIELFETKSGTIQTHTNHKDIVAAMLSYNPMAHPSVMMRKNVFEKQGRALYKKEYPYAEDYKLWTDLAAQGFHFANVPEVLLQYRCSENQVTNSKWEKMHDSSLKIRREYAEQAMRVIIEKDNRYIKFFDRLIELSKEKIMDMEQISNIVYQVYIKYL